MSHKTQIILKYNCIYFVYTINLYYFCINNVYIMETTVRNWGNSLGIRIPKVFSAETGISTGSKVDISIESGKLIIVPIVEKDKTLSELLKGVTKENLHSEIETDSTGEEVW